MLKIILGIIAYFVMDGISMCICGYFLCMYTERQMEKRGVVYDRHDLAAMCVVSVINVIKSINPIGPFGDLIWPILLIGVCANFNEICDEVILKITLNQYQG